MKSSIEPKISVSSISFQNFTPVISKKVKSKFQNKVDTPNAEIIHKDDHDFFYNDSNSKTYSSQLGSQKTVDLVLASKEIVSSKNNDKIKEINDEVIIFNNTFSEWLKQVKCQKKHRRRMRYLYIITSIGKRAINRN